MSILEKNKLFWIEICLFTLLFLLISAGVFTGQEAIEGLEFLKDMAIGKDVQENELTQLVNFFFPQEGKAVCWIKFSYTSREEFFLRWEWINPQGKRYCLGEVKMEAGDYNNYRSWYWIKIKDRPASQLFGEWKVKVYINDLFLGEKSFYIISSS